MKIDMANVSYRDSHEILASVIAPRPIAFVSTVGDNGVFNLAPFSFFAPLCTKPALVGFNVSSKRDGQKKDTVRNIESTREFVINVVDEPMAESMNKASANYPSNVSEFNEVGLTPVKADLVKAPLVAESPVNMECRVVQILEFGEAPRTASFIIGEVLRVHIKDELYLDGEIQPSQIKPIARLGGELFCRTGDMFAMKRPYIYE